MPCGSALGRGLRAGLESAGAAHRAHAATGADHGQGQRVRLTLDQPSTPSRSFRGGEHPATARAEHAAPTHGSSAGQGRRRQRSPAGLGGGTAPKGVVGAAATPGQRGTGRARIPQPHSPAPGQAALRWWRLGRMRHRRRKVVERGGVQRQVARRPTCWRAARRAAARSGTVRASGPPAPLAPCALASGQGTWRCVDARRQSASRSHHARARRGLPVQQAADRLRGFTSSPVRLYRSLHTTPPGLRSWGVLKALPFGGGSHVLR